MKSKSHSLSNVSRDSGVSALVKPRMSHHQNGHSRSVSNASSNYTAAYSEVDESPSLKLNRKCLFILIGFLFVLLSCFSYVYFPLVLKRIIQTYINIKPNEEFYNFWIQSSEPTEVGLHFFHIENPWAVENGLEKLKVKETEKYYFK